MTIGRLVCLLFLVAGVCALSVDLCVEDDVAGPDSYPSKDVASAECGCERTSCIRKCCKPGFYLKKRACIRHNSTETFAVEVYTNKTQLVDTVYKNGSYLVGVMENNCTYFRLNPAANPQDELYVQDDGKLWVPAYKQFFGNDQYCVDELHGVTVLLCFAEKIVETVEREVTVLGRVEGWGFLHQFSHFDELSSNCSFVNSGENENLRESLPRPT